MQETDLHVTPPDVGIAVNKSASPVGRKVYQRRKNTTGKPVSNEQAIAVARKVIAASFQQASKAADLENDAKQQIATSRSLQQMKQHSPIAAQRAGRTEQGSTPVAGLLAGSCSQELDSSTAPSAMFAYNRTAPVLPTAGAGMPMACTTPSTAGMAVQSSHSSCSSKPIPPSQRAPFPNLETTAAILSPRAGFPQSISREFIDLVAKHAPTEVHLLQSDHPAAAAASPRILSAATQLSTLVQQGQPGTATAHTPRMSRLAMQSQATSDSSANAAGAQEQSGVSGNAGSATLLLGSPRPQQTPVEAAAVGHTSSSAVHAAMGHIALFASAQHGGGGTPSTRLFPAAGSGDLTALMTPRTRAAFSDLTYTPRRSPLTELKPIVATSTPLELQSLALGLSSPGSHAMRSSMQSSQRDDSDASSSYSSSSGSGGDGSDDETASLATTTSSAAASSARTVILRTGHVRHLSEEIPGLFAKGTPVKVVEGLGRTRVVPTAVKLAQQEAKAKAAEKVALEEKRRRAKQALEERLQEQRKVLEKQQSGKGTASQDATCTPEARVTTPQLQSLRGTTEGSPVRSSAGRPKKPLVPRLSLRSSAGVTLTPESTVKAAAGPHAPGSSLDLEKTIPRPRHTAAGTAGSRAAVPFNNLQTPSTIATAAGATGPGILGSTPAVLSRPGSGSSTPRPSMRGGNQGAVHKGSGASTPRSSVRNAGAVGVPAAGARGSGASTPRPGVATKDDAAYRRGSGSGTPRPAMPATLVSAESKGMSTPAVTSVPRLNLSLALTPSPTQAAAPGDSKHECQKPWRSNMKPVDSKKPDLQPPKSARRVLSEMERADLLAFRERKLQETAEKLRREKEEREAVVYRRVAARKEAAQKEKNKVGGRKNKTPVAHTTLALAVTPSASAGQVPAPSGTSAGALSTPLPLPKLDLSTALTPSPVLTHASSPTTTSCSPLIARGSHSPSSATKRHAAPAASTPAHLKKQRVASSPSKSSTRKRAEPVQHLQVMDSPLGMWIRQSHSPSRQGRSPSASPLRRGRLTGSPAASPVAQAPWRKASSRSRSVSPTASPTRSTRPLTPSGSPPAGVPSLQGMTLGKDNHSKSARRAGARRGASNRRMMSTPPHGASPSTGPAMQAANAHSHHNSLPAPNTSTSPGKAAIHTRQQQKSSPAKSKLKAYESPVRYKTKPQVPKLRLHASPVKAAASGTGAQHHRPGHTPSPGSAGIAHRQSVSPRPPTPREKELLQQYRTEKLRAMHAIAHSLAGALQGPPRVPMQDAALSPLQLSARSSPATEQGAAHQIHTVQSELALHGAAGHDTAAQSPFMDGAQADLLPTSVAHEPTHNGDEWSIKSNLEDFAGTQRLDSQGLQSPASSLKSPLKSPLHGAGRAMLEQPFSGHKSKLEDSDSDSCGKEDDACSIPVGPLPNWMAPGPLHKDPWTIVNVFARNAMASRQAHAPPSPMAWTVEAPRPLPDHPSTHTPLPTNTASAEQLQATFKDQLRRLHEADQAAAEVGLIAVDQQALAAHKELVRLGRLLDQHLLQLDTQRLHSQQVDALQALAEQLHQKLRCEGQQQLHGLGAVLLQAMDLLANMHKTQAAIATGLASGAEAERAAARQAAPSQQPSGKQRQHRHSPLLPGCSPAAAHPEQSPRHSHSMQYSDDFHSVTGSSQPAMQKTIGELCPPQMPQHEHVQSDEGSVVDQCHAVGSPISAAAQEAERSWDGSVVDEQLQSAAGSAASQSVAEEVGLAAASVGSDSSVDDQLGAWSAAQGGQQAPQKQPKQVVPAIQQGQQVVQLQAARQALLVQLQQRQQAIAQEQHVERLTEHCAEVQRLTQQILRIESQIQEGAALVPAVTASRSLQPSAAHVWQALPDAKAATLTAPATADELDKYSDTFTALSEEHAEPGVHQLLIHTPAAGTVSAATPHHTEEVQEVDDIESVSGLSAMDIAELLQQQGSGANNQLLAGPAASVVDPSPAVAGTPGAEDIVAAAAVLQTHPTRSFSDSDIGEEETPQAADVQQQDVAEGHSGMESIIAAAVPEQLKLPAASEQQQPQEAAASPGLDEKPGRSENAVEHMPTSKTFSNGAASCDPNKAAASQRAPVSTALTANSEHDSIANMQQHAVSSCSGKADMVVQESSPSMHQLPFDHSAAPSAAPELQAEGGVAPLTEDGSGAAERMVPSTKNALAVAGPALDPALDVPNAEAVAKPDQAAVPTATIAPNDGELMQQVTDRVLSDLVADAVSVMLAVPDATRMQHRRCADEVGASSDASAGWQAVLSDVPTFVTSLLQRAAQDPDKWITKDGHLHHDLLQQLPPEEQVSGLVLLDCANEALQEVMGLSYLAASTQQGAAKVRRLVQRQDVQQSVSRKVALWARRRCTSVEDFDRTLRHNVMQDERWWSEQHVLFHDTLVHAATGSLLQELLTDSVSAMIHAATPALQQAAEARGA